MTLCPILAAHVAKASFDALPPVAAEAARRALVDTLAVAWGARGASGVAAGMAVASSAHQPATSTLWQTGTKSSPRAAAFANSVAAAALDFDSIHPGAAIHPDIVCVPVALSVGEMIGASGKDLLAAIAMGSDLICRLALSTRANSGWFYTSVYGPIVSAAITAKLLGASPETIADAMGLGYMNAAGTYQPVAERSPSKRALAAFAVDSGVLCGQLAVAGLSGPREWLDGPFGLYALYEKGDSFHVTHELGSVYRNAETNIKAYPSCQANHAPIDALLSLKSEMRVSKEDAESIEVVLSPYMNRLVGAPYEPGTNPQVAAQFSVQYSLACAMLYDRVGIAEISAAADGDPEVRSWAARVRVTVDQENRNNYCPATVKVKLRDGTELSRTASVLRGSVEAPLTDEQLKGKMAECLDAGGYEARPDRVEQVFDEIGRVDEAPEIGAWMTKVVRLVNTP